MVRLLALVAGSVVCAGCLSSSGPTPDTGAPDAGFDATPPVSTVDASVVVDAGPGAFTAFGSGQIERSSHYTLITKTGDEPGGAGLQRSGTYHLISGAAPSGSIK